MGQDIYTGRACLLMDIKSFIKRKYDSFIRNLFEMVDDHSTDAIVSWSESGKSFIVWNESEFCRNVLPSFLMFYEMAPFVRHLRYWGFKKIESEPWEFSSEYFVRGHPELEPPPEAFEYERPSKEESARNVERMKEMADAIRKRLAKKAKRQAKKEAGMDHKEETSLIV
ncbi:hypothetical protein IGI04_009537 [Brassica rapa subsp. trilocularis]|uniref:HSF-type DNA-binding domain-containing protein n=1 Tax=Brassica rapa subsp. trilocularis TaxID=1813537 RepID=A0ABQ7MXL6_BRACM|nr:hypothetical protein IGI04_009537 [Brassica rapa subsp. trilocularis]